MKENKDDELQFVVDHYKEGHKNSNSAWKEFLGLSGLSGKTSNKRWLVAACITFAAIMAVAATVFIVHRGTIKPTAPSVNTEKVVTDSLKEDSVQVKDSVKVFRFDNTPVNLALKDISDYYGITLEASDTTKNISGEFEAKDINEAISLLEATLNIKIKKK